MKIAAKMAATISPGRTSGSMTRHSTPSRRAAVDHRRVVELARDLVEEADQDPDHQRQGERDVGQDQARVACPRRSTNRIIRRIGMATAIGGMKRKLRIVLAQSVAAAEAQAREGVGGGRADDQRDRRRSTPVTTIEFIDEAEEARVEQHVVVVLDDLCPCRSRASAAPAGSRCATWWRGSARITNGAKPTIARTTSTR